MAGQPARAALALAQDKQMQHVLPLTYSTLGRVLAAQGEVAQALEAFAQAESAALKLGMRPAIVQSRLAAASVLKSAGREEEANEKRVKAQATIEEIAALFQDEALRQAYLNNTREKTLFG
jgi:ATP/maltotriose-dependent transcriptional regulator MalT